MIVCVGSFYLSYFIMIVLSNILFFISVKHSEGDLKSLVIVKIAFEFIVFMSIPLMMIITQGVCVAK